MKSKGKLSKVLYCIASLVVYSLYVILTYNYDSSILPNEYVFYAIGFFYLGYIPWTIIRGIHYRKNGEPIWLVVAVLFTLFLLMIFFGEITKYQSYLAVINKFK